MRYGSPAAFCATYAEAHSDDKTDRLGTTCTLDSVTVVSETSDTAHVEALWYLYGHAPEAGFYDLRERTAIILVKQHDGWRVHTEADLGSK
jgi:ketosteroid isomerase-like protein